MRGQRNSVNNTRRNITMLERTSRQEAEALVVTNHTTPKASPMLSKTERKVFNKLKKYNDSFTEADSTSLNMLAQYIDIWSRLKAAHNELDITDERAVDLERRMTAIDKQIAQHMSALCIPLNQRFRLANDIAKVMIEEKKLEQMNGPKEVNPLLALLEDDDE